MGAGVYVGRIGALAVALGIGAAVFVGQGVASAEPSATSGSESSSTSTSSSSSENKQPAEEKADASTDSSDIKPAAAEPKPKKKKATVRSDATESTKTADEPKKADEPKVAEDVAPTVSVTVEKPEEQPPATSIVKANDPVAVATVAVSTPVSAVPSPFAGNSPTAPVESPLPWMMMAAARQEFGRTATLSKVTTPVTTSGAADPVQESTLAAAPNPVVAISQTPLLAPLQQLPIVGPMFVTPIVAIVHQIPLIGDILHPIIGYPVGLTGGSTPRDVTVISSDGTAIYVHFFPAQGAALGTQAPTILNGPGLGLPGETNPTAADNPFLANQVIGMAPLLKNGYNVVTWDPRGEWSSGGRLEIDHQNFEGQDMKAIITWLATQPEVALDSPGDPKLGMVGASYGGGIQLVTAAIDPRVDAIVPTIAWNNLNTSLDKNGAPKTSWGTLLTAALLFTGARVNPQIYTAITTALLTGSVPKADELFLNERSPFELVNQITAPTLLIQGTVDTLFTLAEADANAKALIAHGVPTKVVWYCGGHGGCISSTNDGEVIERATLDWLDRYVKDDLSVVTGPQFEWVDQHGTQFTSNTYPVPTGTSLEASNKAGGTLPLLLLLGGSGPNFRAFEGGLINGFLGLLSGAKASNAVEVTLPAPTTTTYIVGAPQLEFSYSGTGSSRHVYAQLVDNKTGLVLGNHVTPIPVTLDGETHRVNIPLEMVAHTLAPGETVTLQIVASAVTYQALWSSGELNVSSIRLTLPTANAAAITQTSAAALVA
ncbi:MAG: type transport system ATP-binding protein [Mycobacterium sp.]|nr:type transport system ATP-binding protein [Mycobacterium sp.]